MKQIINTLFLFVPVALMLALMLAGCTKERETISLGGDTDLLALTLDEEYAGIIDKSAGTVTVALPYGHDASAMTVTGLEVSEGATANVAEGDVLNMNFPHTVTVTNGDVFSDYTVTVDVEKNDTPLKAFIGIEPSVEELGDEAKAAAKWALENVPNITYVYLNDVKDGKVKLEDYKMLWCHFDWTDWPDIIYETRDLVNAYYMKGGNILASRDGARYINDTWRISLNQKDPNNCFDGEYTLSEPDGFSIYNGAESHEIYKDIALEGGKILLRAAGALSTNRTLQWGIDWDPYFGLDGWKSQTGALPLASDKGGDPNRVTIAEFTPRETAGSMSGTVITIGTPAFEWYDRNGVENEYFGNMEQLTKNAINYLCK